MLLLTERRGKPFAGRTFWLYMLFYAASRFVIEIYRGDPRGTLLGMSTSQFVSVILVPASLFMLWRLKGSGRSRGAEVVAGVSAPQAP